jgi:hypothetical protein
LLRGAERNDLVRIDVVSRWTTEELTDALA